MSISKIKENKLLFFSLIFLSLASISFAHLSMAIILAAISVVFVCALNFEDGFIFTAFISSFCMSFGYKYICYPILCVALLILTFKAYALNKEKWVSLRKSLKILILLSLVYLFVQPVVYLIVFKSIKGLGILPKLYIFLLMFVLIFLARGKVNLKKFTKYFVASILLSCIISCIGFVTDFINYEVFAWEKGVNNVWRFTGIFPHANVLVRSCILAMCLLLINIFKEPKKVVNYILVLMLIAIGLITASKSFLILLVVLSLVVLTYSFVVTKNKKVWWKFFGIFIVACAIVCVALIPYIKMMYTRFVSFFTEGSVLDMITTGRISIWKDFYNDFISKPIYIILGKSFMGEIPVKIGIHNTYFALMYQYGLLGTLIFILFAIIMIKNTTGYSKKFSFYIPIILLLVSGLTEDHIFTHFGPLYLVVAMMFMFNEENANMVNEKEVIFKQLYLFIKRAFDIVVSLIGLIIACIPMLIVAILVKLSSKGPVLFKDKRIGKDGKQIVVYKFRSMYVDAESRLEQYLTKEQYELWKTERKIENDPRITKWGKFIRKTSLDELPQLINILKGDLSLIGNRPISKLEYDTWFSDEEKEEINTMRPGLTGYWQVYGRSEVDWQSGKRKEMCMYYSRKASIWLDIKIFFRTFIVVIFRRGAK